MFAVAAPSTAVTAVAVKSTQQAMIAVSRDGRRTWQQTLSLTQEVIWRDFGFTTASQGFAISWNAQGSTMYVTGDAGASWSPVRFAG